MDPAKPACEACDTTEGELYLSDHAGWLCKDVTACYERIEASGATVAGRARAIMGELRSMDPTFGMASSIPLDLLHPTGRCTCGGEGRCAWCQEICQSCGGYFDEFGCRACNNTGYADGLYLTAEERAAKIAAIRAEECDYEALGYQETNITEAICGVDGLAMGIDVYLGTMVGDAWERAVRWRDIQKDIRSDTDNG